MSELCSLLESRMISAMIKSSSMPIPCANGKPSLPPTGRWDAFGGGSLCGLAFGGTGGSGGAEEVLGGMGGVLDVMGLLCGGGDGLATSNVCESESEPPLLK